MAKVKRRVLRMQILQLQDKVGRLSLEVADLTAARDHYRRLYEELNSSPEIKADTEAAFKRGESHQRSKFRQWLLSSAYEIDDPES